MGAAKRSTGGAAARSPADVVGEVLEHYARRGVFRGFGRGESRRGRAAFRIQWHRDRFFDFVVDPRRKTLRFPSLLPDVDARSPMRRHLKAWVESRHSPDLPEHRRIDRRRVEVKTYCRNGEVTLTAEIEDGDYEYAARKLVHLVHELFLDFLRDGRYYDYMVENFGLDADEM